MISDVIRVSLFDSRLSSSFGDMTGTSWKKSQVIGRGEGERLRYRRWQGNGGSLWGKKDYGKSEDRAVKTLGRWAATRRFHQGLADFGWKSKNSWGNGGGERVQVIGGRFLQKTPE